MIDAIIAGAAAFVVGAVAFSFVGYGVRKKKAEKEKRRKKIKEKI